jgi:tetratricopeptide (TPR) repeat protein/Zn-dependent protease
MSGLMLAIAVLLGWIITVCLHEFGHAVVAYYGGDTTVKEKGYLTLNPLKYTDIGYSLVLPVVFLIIGGIALPGAAVYINTALLKNRGWKSAVSAAGPLTTGIVAIALSLPFQLGWAVDDFWIWKAFALLTTFQVAGFCFNLLPVPSFDGFGIIEPWLPRSMQHATQRWGRYGYLVLIGLFWTVPAFNQSFWEVVGTISHTLGVPRSLMGRAYVEFEGASKGVFIVLLVGALIYRQIFKDKQQTSEQVEDLEKTLGAYDQLIQNQQTTPEIWFQRGQTLSSLGRFNAAIDSYNAALKEHDAKAKVYYGRAVARHQTNQYHEALLDYDRCLALEPNHSYAWANKARILQHLRDYQGAIAAYDRSLKVETASALCWQERGNILQKLGQNAEALDSYKQALKYDQGNAALWIKQAELLCDQGDIKQAINSYDRAVRLDPENIAVRRSQGSLHIQLGQNRNALKSYSAALFHNPQDSAALLLRGLTLYNLKQFELAYKDFESIWVLLQEELKQPARPAEALSNLSPALKPAVEKLSVFLRQPADSTVIAIVQGLVLVILERPKSAISLYAGLSKETSPELEQLKGWVTAQIKR